MFGKATSTIRAACWEHGLPYRLETTWGPGGRRFRRMVFSMREISALLDHYAPPVNQVLDAAMLRLGRGRHPRRPTMTVADLAREAARQTAGVAASARWMLPRGITRS